MENLTVPELLDRAKKQLGVESDYRLAKVLKLHLHTVLNYRHGRTLPDEKSCIALGRAAHVDTAVLIVQMNELRAKDDETRAIWHRIAERLSATAAAAIFAVFAALISIAPDASAAPVSGHQNRTAATFEMLYIVSIKLLSALFLFAMLARFSGPGFVPCWTPHACT